jgi:hypothetical protein
MLCLWCIENKYSNTHHPHLSSPLEGRGKVRVINITLRLIRGFRGIYHEYLVDY